MLFLRGERKVSLWVWVRTVRSQRLITENRKMFSKVLKNSRGRFFILYLLWCMWDLCRDVLMNKGCQWILTDVY